MLAWLLGVASNVAADEPFPLQPADTSSPKATLLSFVDACNRIYEIIHAEKQFDRRGHQYLPVVKRIFDCMDLRKVPECARDQYAGEAAISLKEVLDRIEWPDDKTLEKVSQSRPDLVRWRVPGTRLVIEKMKDGPQAGEYLYTAETVKRASDFYQEIKHLPYRETTGPKVAPDFYNWFLSEPGNPYMAPFVRSLPSWFRTRLWGLAVWRWVGLILTMTLGILALVGVYHLGAKVANWTREKRPILYLLTMLFQVVGLLIPFGLKVIVDNYLTLRGGALYVSFFALDVVILVAGAVLIMAAGNRIAELVIASPAIQTRGLDAHFTRIITKVLSIGAVVILCLEGGRSLGIPITTLIASAGVGGLAVALAAQDTLKNLFGSMMILFDKPYKVGERIVIKGYDGVVEEIGMRSTRIRLLTGHMVSIPNEEMARSDIENIARRPHIRRKTNMHIPLNTPVAKIEKAIAVIRSAFEDHEGMDPERPPKVYFNEFNNDSFNVCIFCWFSPPDYWKYLEFTEQVNFTIVRAFEEQGIPFSLP